jgi:hypothetical protein
MVNALLGAGPTLACTMPKRCMYVLYQAAIIWVLPEEKFEKKVSPPIGGQKVEPFFSPFLDPLPVYEFL